MALAAAHAVWALPVEVALGGGVKAQVATLQIAGQQAELRSMVARDRDGVFMLVSARPESPDAPGTAQTLAVTAALSTGELQSRPVRQVGSNAAALVALDASPLAGALLSANDGGVPHTLAVNNDLAVLTRFDAQGRAERAFPVALELRSVQLRRFVAAGGDTFLAVGAAGSHPLLSQIGSAGQVVWKQVLTEEADAAVIAALPRSDGVTLVLIEKGTPEDPRFVFGSVGRDGKWLTRTELSGRPVDLAANGNLAVALVERSGVATKTLLAIAFGAAPQPLWQRELLVERGLLARYRVVGLPQGGFVVAGRKDRGLWLTRLSGDGSSSWTSWSDPRQSPELEMTLDVDLARSANGVVLAYSATIVRDRRQFAVVRAMSVRLD